MGDLVHFPSGFVATRAILNRLSGEPLMEPAVILVLPVVRIERNLPSSEEFIRSSPVEALEYE